MENEFDVSIFPRGNFLKISGKEANVGTTAVALKKIYEEVLKNKVINTGEINAIINIIKYSNMEKKEDDIDFVNSISFTLEEELIKPRSKKQMNTLIWSKIKKWFFVVALPGQGKLILQ